MTTRQTGRSDARHSSRCGFSARSARMRWARPSSSRKVVKAARGAVARRRGRRSARRPQRDRSKCCRAGADRHVAGAGANITGRRRGRAGRRRRHRADGRQGAGCHPHHLQKATPHDGQQHSLRHLNPGNRNRTETGFGCSVSSAIWVGNIGERWQEAEELGREPKERHSLSH